MRRESHVRFCEGVGVKFPRATRLFVGLAPTATLRFPFALSATLYFPAHNFLSATRSQSIGFRKMATATL